MSGGSGKTLQAKSLTQLTIQALKAEPRPYRLPDAKCAGLAIRVAVNGSKTWDFSFRLKHGKVRRISLGNIELVSLEEARLRAHDVRKAAREGRDLPAEEFQKQIESQRRISVTALIDEYAKRRLAGRLRTAHEIELRLRRSLKKVGKFAAADLQRRDIRDILNAVADAGHLREAEQRRQVIGTMLRWARGQDYIATNPAEGLTSYSPGSVRDRVLTQEEIACLWDWLTPTNLPAHHASILKLQLLLGARCGEICGMRKEEFDLDESVWTLPANRSKNAKSRSLPLIGLAKEIVLERLSVSGAAGLFLSEFGSTLRSVNVGNLLVKRRADMPIPHFTSHDLRRTTATRMIELGISIETVAAILGHQSGGAETRTLVRHYVKTERLPEKARALSAWDDYLRTVLGGKTEKVVALKRAS